MSREDFEGLKDHARQCHKERVAKNPERIDYAINQFEKHNVEYLLTDMFTGHFRCYRKSDDKLFEFYAGTGKIKGIDDKRGIHALIKLLEEEADFELDRNHKRPRKS